MKKENILNLFLMVVIGVLVVVGSVSAATTISTDIITEGKIGIGTSTPYAKLSVAGQVVANNTWATSTTEINYFGGSIGIGTFSPATAVHLVKEGTGAYISASTYRNSAFAGGLVLTHARGTTASPVVLNDGDRIASIFFKAHDGSIDDTVNQTNNAAAIEAWADGSQSLGSFPGRITFSTAVTGLQVERMRVTSLGNVGIGTTTPATRLHVSSGSSATTTVSIGELGLSSSKGCVNMNQANGSAGSFYLVGGALVVETNYCR